MDLSRYSSAQKIFNFYIEKLEMDDTMESKWCLQWINLQMAKFKCDGILNMLYCYPLELEDITDGE